MFNSNNSFGKVRDTKIGLSNTFCNGIPYTTANCQLFSALCLMLTAIVVIYCLYTCAKKAVIMCIQNAIEILLTCHRNCVLKNFIIQLLVQIDVTKS